MNNLKKDYLKSNNENVNNGNFEGYNLINESSKKLSVNDFLVHNERNGNNNEYLNKLKGNDVR
jgi:hypothetical protein